MEPGTRLGQYEILDRLGAGGMGEVYRARDTKLKRDVALKLLPEDLATDSKRLARLEREAQMLAAVSHPGIATIHNLDDADGVRFLVLEVVEGPTLAERLEEGPLSVEASLEVGQQIAKALEVAHERGIIHRDLKPANIKFTREGRVKVLDFGLAKEFEHAEGADFTAAATEVSGLTIPGTQVGTAPYMSPEQVRGQSLDKRTDIWAFGCVLYEMLTGSRAFSAETVQDTFSAVLEHEPAWEALPSSTPLTISLLLRRCLQKDPERRLHDIADARIEIEEAPSLASVMMPGAADPSAPTSSWRWMVPWAVAALAVATLIIRPLLPSTTDTEVSSPTYLVLDVEPGLRLSGQHYVEDFANEGALRPTRTAMAISPDGQDVVYCATDGERNYQLYRRQLSAPTAVPMPGTEGGCNPFFSPDGRAVGFFVLKEPGSFAVDLKVISVEGGQPRTLVEDASSGYATGASWGSEGTIVFADNEQLYRVPAAGGSKQPTAQPDNENGEQTYSFPQLLPGEQALVFSVSKRFNARDSRGIVVLSLNSGDRKTLLTNGTDARYVSTGHLVFVREATLMVVPFDLQRLEVAGEPIRVLENVMQDRGFGIGGADTGAAQFAVSDSGTLVYVPGGVGLSSVSMAVVDQRGNARDLDALPPGGSGRVSPDGTQLLFSDVYTSQEQANLWMYDIERATSRVLVSDLWDEDPIWSPDGTRIAYSSRQGREGTDLTPRLVPCLISVTRC